MTAVAATTLLQSERFLARNMQSSRRVGEVPTTHICNRARAPHRVFAVGLRGGNEHERLPSGFAEHMLELEAVLPTMSCSQLAKTGTSVRETYRAALLSTEAAVSSVNSSSSSTGKGSRDQSDVTRDLLDYFNSQLPNQSWLLTYRDAVQKHLPGTGQLHNAAAGEGADASTAGSSSSSSSSSTGSGEGAAGSCSSSTDSHAAGAVACSCSPEHLAAILAAIAALPIQVVQPLPIGFGTPRWSRPLAAADPAAWEQWLAHVATAYTGLLAQHLMQQQQDCQQQQQQSSRHHGSSGACAAPPELLQQLSDFIVSLACSMRWVNVHVDDDKLQTPEVRQRVLQCLQQQQEQEQQQQRQQQQRQVEAARAQQLPDQQQVQQQQQRGLNRQAEQQQQEDKQVPFALAGSLAHRLTYTCLLLLLPPPRPMLSAFFADTRPTDFSLGELQGIVRGLLFVGSAPPESWLKGLVQLVRGRAGDLAQRDILCFVEAFRFFGTQVGRRPWLRDVTALLEEFSCAG